MHTPIAMQIAEKEFGLPFQLHKTSFDYIYIYIYMCVTLFKQSKDGKHHCDFSLFPGD